MLRPNDAGRPQRHSYILHASGFGGRRVSPIGQGEPVHVGGMSSVGVPSSFLWRGQRHVVRQVEAVRLGALGRRRADRALRLRTDRGMRCWLSKSAADGQWRMEGVVGGKGG